MNIESKLKEALIKDFDELYVKGFSTDWQSIQVVRRIEINVMKLDNVMKVLNKETKPMTFQDKLQRDLGKG